MTLLLITSVAAMTACDDGEGLDGAAETSSEDGFRALEDAEDVGLPDPKAGGETKASITVCGGTCPVGRHVSADVCTPSCGGYSGFGGCVGTTSSNAVQCAPDTGTSFSACESSCPPDYHVSADTCSSSCSGYSGFGGCVGTTSSNAIQCTRDAGNSFSSCEWSCADGYHVSADTCSSSCAGYSGFDGCVGTTNSNAIQCTRDAGNSFSSCESSCPPDYFTSANTCSSSCSGYSGFGGCVGTLNSNAIQCSFAGDCPWDPGDPQYCADCGPCGLGEGSCSNDNQCEAGLVCSGSQCVQAAAVGDLSASPEVVGISGVLGVTTIGASVEFATNPQVWVSVDGAPSTLFASLAWLGPQGGDITQEASWIQIGPSYEFTLYENGLGSAVLDSVTVTGERVCLNSQYLYDGACYSRPYLDLTSDDGSSCGDLGVAYPPPGYLVRTRVTGRPGATVEIYNQHVSCGGEFEVATDSGAVIPPSGVLEMDIATGAGSADCSFGGLFGRWRKHVVVDGHQSNDREFTFYNSQCGGAGIGSCGEAYGYCEG